MNDKDALLQAIITNPDDDTPRLMFADWLDEQGKPDDTVQAAFIRKQVRQARLPEAGHNPDEVAQALLHHGSDWEKSQLQGAEVIRTGFQRGFINQCSLPYSSKLGDNAPLKKILTGTPITHVTFCQQSAAEYPGYHAEDTGEHPSSRAWRTGFARLGNPASAVPQTIPTEWIFPEGDAPYLERLRVLEFTRPRHLCHGLAIAISQNLPSLKNLRVLKADATHLPADDLRALIDAPHLHHTILDLDVRRSIYAPRVLPLAELDAHNKRAAAWQREELAAGRIAPDGGISCLSQIAFLPLIGKDPAPAQTPPTNPVQL